MITNGWLNWATWYPGPVNKAYPWINSGLGIVWHSMEGWKAGSFAELDKPTRQASWLFSIGLDGVLYQHYSVDASCWASGNEFANTHYWSVELEGVQPSEINDYQIQTALALINEWENYTGLQAYRSGNWNTQTMHQHREVATIATPNAGPTACPSNRYAQLWETLKEDEMVYKEQLEETNIAINKRMKIIQLGSDMVEYEKMLRAYDVLKQAGLVS